MDSSAIQRMQQQFDTIARDIPGEEVEFWFARELQEPLGYARWENFIVAIHRAIDSCKSTGYAVADHFRGVSKMVQLGSFVKKETSRRPN